MAVAEDAALERALEVRSAAKAAARSLLQEDARRGLVLLGYRGSLAHGTYVPPEEAEGTDDVDLMGVHVAPLSHYVGWRRKELETVEVGPGGPEDPWDVVSYEARHYVDLLRKANPNVLQLLWIPDEMILWRSRVGLMLREARSVFATRAALEPFRGYARSQLRRLSGGPLQGYMGEKRRRLVERHGYDTKYAAHLLRLLYQGREFLLNGRMTFPRPEAEQLRAVKRGAWERGDVERRARHLLRELERAAAESPLPEEPDREKVEALLMLMVMEHHDFRRDRKEHERARHLLWGAPGRALGTRPPCKEC